jgi:prepilin-type N-terminal cleavage/methylation domain-containing protein
VNHPDRIVAVKTRRSLKRPRAFTLVELLVVIAIVGTGVSLLLPAVQRSREASRRTQCASNLHAMGVALTAYESARRAFPPGSDTLSGRFHAWSSFILPYLDAETVSRRIDYARPWNVGTNAEIADVVLATYVCPSGIRMFPGKQDYGGVLGSGVILDPAVPLPRGWDHGGVLYATDAAHPRPVRTAMITDGLANTIVVSEGVDRGFEDMDGESRIGNARWACGTNCFLLSSRVVNTPDVDGFRSHHTGGVHGLFADGRVAFMGDDTAAEVLVAICTKDGREATGRVP